MLRRPASFSQPSIERARKQVVAPHRSGPPMRRSATPERPERLRSHRCGVSDPVISYPAKVQVVATYLYLMGGGGPRRDLHVTFGICSCSRPWSFSPIVLLDPRPRRAELRETAAGVHIDQG